MKSSHAFALIALILGIVGGVLLCKSAADVALRLLQGESRHINLELLALAGIGAIAIIASTMVWKGDYITGGVINIVLGIIAVFYGKDAEGTIVLISGILGVIAPKIKD